MKKIAVSTLATLCALALAACSDPQQAPADSAHAGQPAATEAAGANAGNAAAPAGFAYSPLPEGVSVSSPYQVRSDRVYQTKSGAERRRATLELLEGDPVAAIRTIGGQLEAQGFHALPVADKGDEVTRLAYRKREAGRINMAAWSDIGERPSNPHSVGVLWVDWQLTPAPDAAQDQDDAADADAGPDAEAPATDGGTDDTTDAD